MKREIILSLTHGYIYLSVRKNRIRIPRGLTMEIFMARVS